MNPVNLSNKRFILIVQCIGILFFGTLLFFSLHFYKERMLAFDSANYSMEIEQFRSYCLPHGRWSSVFSQLLPLYALNSGASLIVFLKLYSASFILIYYILFLLCTLALKNYKAGLALMLSQSLGFAWMFYYTISELLMGMAFAILLYAVVNGVKPNTTLKKTIVFIVSFFLVYTISFFHQLALFPALFVIIFEIISEKRWKDPTLIVTLIMAIVWSYIRIKVYSVDDYTHGKILSFDTYYQQLFNLFDLPSFNYVKGYLISLVKWLGYLIILCIVLLVWRRQWLVLFIWLGFTAGYLLLVILTYYKGESGLMIETYLPPVGLYTGLVMLYLFYEDGKAKRLLLLTSWLLFVSLRGMYLASEKQLVRTDYLKRLIEYGHQFPNHKYMLNTKNLPSELVNVPWALPLETALMSALDSKDSCVTFAYKDDASQVYNEVLKRNYSFIGPEWRADWPFKNDANMFLPMTYYLSVNSCQKDTGFHVSDYNAGNIKIIPIEETVEVPYHGNAYINVKIVNTSGHKINSIPDSENPLKISYHIYTPDGKMLEDIPYKTTLEVDIYTVYTQAVKVKSPRNKGDYILEVDLVEGENHWLHCGTRFKLHIPDKSIWRWM